MRGIAIGLVVAHHLFNFPHAGYLGVDLFFVLSGFLITFLLAEEWGRTGSISLLNFYWRRALRLVPALLLWMVGLKGLEMAGLSAFQVGASLWLPLVYCLNWFLALGKVSFQTCVSITWSLAIEEQFYLLWPAMLRGVLRRMKHDQILQAITLVVLLVGVWRWWLVESGATWFRVYYGSDTRADQLLIGAAAGLFYLWDGCQKVARKWCLVSGWLGRLVILAALAGRLTFESAPDQFLLTLLSLAFGLEIFNAVAWPDRLARLLLRHWVLRFLGRISYGLYLWHWTARLLVFGQARPEGIQKMLLALVLSLVLSWLSYVLWEQRFLRMKKRFAR